MELTFAAATDVGRARDHNEDNFLIDKKLRLFVVCDGMGGHAAGEVASSITVHQIRDAVYQHRGLIDRFVQEDAAVQEQEVLQLLERAIQDACATVYNRAQAEPEKRGMGTTASVLLIAGDPSNLRGFIAHVGDSRIYLTRQDECHQLTEDHSLMNELIRRGKIKEEEFETSPYKKFKNAVTRAVGVYASVEVDTFDFDILPGDSLLLCSDGMYVYFTDSELPGLLTTGDVKDVPTALIDRANAGGGHDNITNVVVRVLGDAEQSEDGGDNARAEELSLKLEVLKGMQLFRYLSYKELVGIMNMTETREYLGGELIIGEGDEGDAMFVVLAGSVRLHQGPVDLALLEKGQHFGEMALIDRTVRSLSATSEKTCRLIVIGRKEFYSIIKKQPELSVKLLWSFVQELATRLRKTTADLGALKGDENATLPFEEE
ncbi:MAG: cyclic nucleotide-binding domain-containing protein [Myxococcales bacterium]|nr:cyclic nucleotide-binding domain-containing protein [Myxococcales bacterium]